MSEPTSDRPPAVELAGITKRFPGVVANRDVHLSVERGEVHAVVGENGAGKSTLMKILYGMQRPDEGTIAVDGQPVELTSPTAAIGLGIGMVHQHFMLADNLTVLENIVLGSEPRAGVRLDIDAARRRITDLSQAYGFDVDPDELVEDLGVGERQRVEILKVLYRGAQILILDEPTAVLVPQEVEELFANLRELKNEGVTTIFISHKLDEVLAIADTITVMRAGTTVGTVNPGEVTTRDLAELMVGSELPTPEIRGTTVTEVVELDVRDLTVTEPNGRTAVDHVSFQVRRGEIVGLAGVEGNGQSELIEALLGLVEPSAGTIWLGGRDVTSWPTGNRRRAGLGYIPQDRHREGLLLSEPLWENAMLGHQRSPGFSRSIWIDRKGARARTEAIVAAYDVRTPSVDVAAHALSGGNQQKLIVGREMEAGPTLLVAAHPTRGIDVGAQAAIWERLRDARALGLGVLLVSADLDELIGLSDTICVIHRGHMVTGLDPATLSAEDLGLYMTGTAPTRAGGDG